MQNRLETPLYLTYYKHFLARLYLNRKKPTKSLIFQHLPVSFAITLLT